MALPVNRAKANLVVSSPTELQYEMVCWYYSADAPDLPNQDSVQDLADQLDAVYGPLLKAVLTASCNYNGVAVSANIGGGTYTAIGNTHFGVGTLSGDFQPPQVAAVVRKGSDDPGRSGRGRWFLPLVPEVLTLGYGLTGAGQTAYNTLAAALIANQGAGGTTWIAGLYSRKNMTIHELNFAYVSGLLKRFGKRELHPLIG